MPYYVWDEGISIHLSDRIMGTDRRFEGHRGVDEAVDVLREAFDDLHMEPERYVFRGKTRVICVLRASMRGRGSGIPIVSPWVLDVTVADGAAVAWDMHTDPQRALEAVGLSE